MKQLIKNTITSCCDLTIDIDFERKIRYVCSKISNVEWSGILFYKHTGTFKNNNLHIYPKDFVLMNIGTASYTEFSINEDVVSYMIDNDLMDCDMGLIHSHNNMNAFFSGTDLQTLLDEGSERNVFVSLIVNNDGEYCAAITRQISADVTEKLRYKTFGDKLEVQDLKYSNEYVEYTMLPIIKVDEFQKINSRIKHINNTQVKAKSQQNIFDYGNDTVE